MTFGQYIGLINGNRPVPSSGGWIGIGSATAQNDSTQGSTTSDA